MKTRSAILGVAALTFALVLRELIVARRSAGPDTQGSTPAAAEAPLRAGRQSGGEAASMTVGTLSDRAVPGGSRFEDALAALPVNAETDDWTPTLDRLADSVPVGELGDA